MDKNSEHDYLHYFGDKDIKKIIGEGINILFDI